MTLEVNVSPVAVISILVIVPGIEVSTDEFPFLLMPKVPAIIGLSSSEKYAVKVKP